MDDYMDLLMGGLIAGLALLLAVGVLFLLYVFGYVVGIYPASCIMVSSQPSCVREGWQQQEKVNLNGEGGFKHGLFGVTGPTK